MGKTIDTVIKVGVGVGLLFTLGCGEGKKIEHAEIMKAVETVEAVEKVLSKKAPVYDYHGNTFIIFEDDYAPHMKAYVSYGPSLVYVDEMNTIGKEVDSYTFKIPKKALDTGEFSVRAYDKDKNESEFVDFYVDDGVVIKK